MSDLRALLQDYLSLLESDYMGPGDKDLIGGKIAKVRAALAEPAPVPLSRLREMFEDYRDAWSPGAKDELLATFYAQLSTAPPQASPTVGQCETRKEREPMRLPDPDPASPSDARDAARLRAVLKEYDAIVEAISPEARERDGRETDFVIRLEDYEILRKAAIEREGGA